MGEAGQGRGVSESENKKKKKKRDRVRVGGRETERAEGHLEGEEDKAGEKQQKKSRWEDCTKPVGCWCVG